mgnify:CR=1 FL=1
MNKKFLLTTAAAFALTVTGANAVDLGSITIHPQVDLVGSFGLVPGDDLKFGVVVVPSEGLANKSITVTHSGNIYADSGVTLLGVTSIGADSEHAAAAGTTTVSAGSLKVTGDIPTLLSTRSGASVGLIFQGQGKTQEVDGETVPLPGVIDLVAEDNTTVCGTVDNIALSGNITTGGSGNGTTYNYGGTLTFSAAAAAGMHCVGTATVTMVFNE